MPLTLRADHRSPRKDRFRIYSGRAPVGMMTRVPGGPKMGWFHWSIMAFHLQPDGIGPGAGMAETQEEAMAQLETCWQAWLAWAGLREMEPHERVRLP